jgi:3-phenylpropionate/trans-cinnamate dioxygenase ferredoxin reductase subunit
MTPASSHSTNANPFFSDGQQAMKSFLSSSGRGVVAGYAARIRCWAAQRDLAIVTAEHVLPYERPSLSKGFLAGKEDASDIQISDADFYRKHGITLHRSFPVGKADLRRHRLHSTSGEVIGFEQLLIATGSTVRRLHVPGADDPGIFYLRQLRDSQRIHAQIKRGQRAVVIGSGFIGMEVASVLASRGVRTTMVFLRIGVEQLLHHRFPPSLRHNVPSMVSPI